MRLASASPGPLTAVLPRQGICIDWCIDWPVVPREVLDALAEGRTRVSPLDAANAVAQGRDNLLARRSQTVSRQRHWRRSRNG